MANVKGIKVGATPANTILAVASPSGSKTDANAQVLRYYKTSDVSSDLIALLLGIFDKFTVYKQYG